MIPLRIASGPIYQREVPVRDAKYLAFIRMLPCVACGKKKWRMEAMHTGMHGLGQKASDLDALPGCHECHRELHKIGPVRFQFKYSVSFDDLRAKFNSFYQSKLKGRAA